MSDDHGGVMMMGDSGGDVGDVGDDGGVMIMVE